MAKYLVSMKITATYQKEVEADNKEDAVAEAWDSGDFGEAFNIDGDVISCEAVSD